MTTTRRKFRMPPLLPVEHRLTGVSYDDAKRARALITVLETHEKLLGLGMRMRLTHSDYTKPAATMSFGRQYNAECKQLLARQREALGILGLPRDLQDIYLQAAHPIRFKSTNAEMEAMHSVPQKRELRVHSPWDPHRKPEYPD